MNKVIQHHGMIRKIAETQKKFKKLREEEMLLRQQLNRHSSTSTSPSASGSNVRSTTNTSSPVTSSATLERTGSSSTGSPAVLTTSLNRRITRQTLRIHQLHNDINNYIETMDSSSPSSDDDSDSDSGDGN